MKTLLQGLHLTVSLQEVHQDQEEDGAVNDIHGRRANKPGRGRASQLPNVLIEEDEVDVLPDLQRDLQHRDQTPSAHEVRKEKDVTKKNIPTLFLCLQELPWGQLQPQNSNDTNGPPSHNC